MKVLYFDLEHGSQSLGSKDQIAKNFGYPMLSPTSWNEFQQTIGKIYTNKSVKETIDMGGFKVDQVTQKVMPKDKVTIDAVVIDTFSELAKKFMRTLTDKDGKMKLNEWGRLKNKLDTALEFITRIPGVVVCTCHSRIQTMDTGENRVLPYIDGSTKDDISKWFDFVFYTKTVSNSDGSRSYKWVTANSEMYNHAKDRTQLLEPLMDQDFSKVLEAANKKGFEGCKILVIGSPGSGKTLSLRTLSSSTTEEVSDEEPDDDQMESMETQAEVNRETEEAMNESLAREAESNGEIPVQRQVAYLRGETNNLEESTNANTNS